MSDRDAVQVTTRVEVDPQRAFRLFTEDVDLWWRRGPRFRWDPEREGRLRFEPGVGGRFVEVYDEAGADVFEVGRIRVWDPPKRLVFDFRARAFAPGETTEVEVRFEPEGGGTRVSVEHRGWGAFAPDHPVRHGLDAVAFRSMMSLWWADLVTAARRHARGGWR